MIPRIFHQIYLGFDKPPESRPLFLESRDAARRVLPDWEYRLWDGPSLRDAVASKGSELARFYDDLRHPVQKVDFGRYVLPTLGWR